MSAPETRRRRVAVCCGRLEVPPNYFVIENVTALADEHDFSLFAHRVRRFDRDIARHLEEVPVTESIVGLDRAIARYRPDVVHQHWAVWSRSAVRAARKRRVPLVVSLHGYDVFLPRTGSARARALHLAKRSDRALTIEAADLFVAASSFLAREAVAAGFPEARVTVQHQGIDTDVFTPSGGAVDDHLLFVGRLSREKGCHLLLSALGLLPEARRPRLVVVGAGPEARALEQQAGALGVRASFLGMLARPQVLEEVRRARALVVPSVPRGTQQEAAGLVTLEAQAVGTPVITTAVGGLPENVAPGLQHLICAPRSEDLAESIDGFMSSDRRDLAKGIRDFVVHERSVRASTAFWDGVYTTLAS